MRTWMLFCLFLAFSAQAIGKKEVFLYTYHKKPPFITELQSYSGLYFDLARVLTSKSQSFQFTTVYLPRKRLNFMIENHELDGIVLGVSPPWFNDKLETLYLWTTGFYTDRDEYVSLRKSPFEFEDQESFIDKTVASVAGYYYAGINESVKKGILKRIDTVGEVEVLQLVEKKRASFGLVSSSVIKYLQKKGELKDIFHFSNTPHDLFERRAFTTKENELAFNELVSILDNIKKTGEWREILSNYEQQSIEKLAR